MGLDMYLTGNRYLASYRDDLPDAKVSKIIQEQFPELQDTRAKVKEVNAEIGYWRKANAIHKWFVDNVQNGEDNCEKYYVDKDKLKELRDICQRVLDFKHLATDLLPTTSGFFFGSTEYDEYYYSDIELTINIIDNAMKLPNTWDLYYQSSW